MPGRAALLPEDPRTAGPYTVVARLGIGGQGTVYAGTAPDGSHVAIKVLHSHLSFDERARRRFLGEVEAAKRVARFCTVQVLGSGVLGHRPYIVTEFVDGPSLQDAVAVDGPRRGAVLDRLAISTATALAAIHRADIVHRDFKPANVLLGPDGPVVIDFGIARALTSSLSTTSQVVGSPAYMAPEQIANAPTGPPADMFAWGVAMVYAASATKAFTGESIPAIMQSILHDEPDLGRLTGQLRDVVQQCLAKDPAERPTAEDVAATLLEHSTTTLEAALSAPPAAQAVPPPEMARAPLVAVAPEVGSLAVPGSQSAESGVPEPVDVGRADATAIGGEPGPETAAEGKLHWGRRPVVVGSVAAAALVLLSGLIAADWMTSPEDDRKVAGEPAKQDGQSAAFSGKPTPTPSENGQTPEPGSSSATPRAPDRGPGASASPGRSPRSDGRSKAPDKPESKPSKKATAPGQPIGSMPYSVLDPYCRAHGHARSATLVNGPFCVTSGNEFVPINMNSVCRWRFPAYPRAVLQSYNSVGGSWTCLSS